jgi:lipoyl(octanoyl) transferase
LKSVLWGLIDYGTALGRQEELVESVRAGGEEVLVFCSHPSVVTVGRGSGNEGAQSWSGAQGWDGPTVNVTRGGLATYHGPEQVIAYPIVDLRKERQSLGARDLHGYMKLLGGAACIALAEWGLVSEYRSGPVGGGSDGPSYTGVWHQDRKIASIGIAARGWVTYHGLALNVGRDPLAFQGINPCGFSSSVMTCMEDELKQKPPKDSVIQALDQALRLLLIQ